MRSNHTCTASLFKPPKMSLLVIYNVTLLGMYRLMALVSQQSDSASRLHYQPPMAILVQNVLVSELLSPCRFADFLVTGIWILYYPCFLVTEVFLSIHLCTRIFIRCCSLPINSVVNEVTVFKGLHRHGRS